jgi:long-chain acyl-CoA synthetase
MYTDIRKGSNGSSRKTKNICQGCCGGEEAAPYFMANKKLPLGLSLKYKIFDKLVYANLKKTMGFERTRVFGSAGAPLLPEIHDFFWGLDMQIRKGYGLTETSPVLNVDGDPTIMPIKSDGWITPFPGAEVKIAEDGEILAKGRGSCSVISTNRSRPKKCLPRTDGSRPETSDCWTVRAM